MELIGDIEETLDALSPLLHRPRLDSRSAELLQRIAEDREQLMALAASKSGNPIHPLRLVSELQKLISSDVTICSDMGSFSIYLCRYLFSFRARQFLITNGQQTLGVALPWAIAASIVRPHEKVLSISGDGGFLFSAAELETAVRLNSHLVHMIWVDGHYDMVATQERIKYGRTSAVGLGRVDYMKYAQAFGATGLQIRAADEIAPTLKKAFDTPGPVLVEVHVDYRDNAKLFEQVHELSDHSSTCSLMLAQWYQRRSDVSVLQDAGRNAGVTQGPLSFIEDEAEHEVCVFDRRASSASYPGVPPRHSDRQSSS